MKKLIGFFSVLFIAVAFLTSCNTGSDTGITITVTQDIDTVQQGVETVVTFTVVAQADGLESIGVASIDITSPDTTINYTYTDGVSSQTVEFKYTVAADAELGNIAFSFATADDQKTPTTATEGSLVIFVGAPAIPEIVTKDDVRFNFDQASTSKNMMLIFEDDGTISYGTAGSANADLAYCYRAGMSPSDRAIVSPDNEAITKIFAINTISYDASSKKKTEVAVYSGSSSWDEIDAEEINELEVTSSTVSYNGGSGNGYGIADGTEGVIIVFETAEGKKGVVQVNDWGTGDKAPVHADAKVKVQKVGNATK